MNTLDHDEAVSEILAAAFAEDDAEGSHFDKIGFFQFCPEEAPAAIEEAWKIYEREIWGTKPCAVCGRISPIGDCCTKLGN